jgi:predicted RND superfamily exporter protein
MKKKISQIYEEYILRFPAFVLVFLTLILIMSLSNMGNFKLDASADTLILEDDKDLKLFREVSSRYKTNDFLVLTITDNNEDIFSIDTLTYIKFISEKISKFKNVQSVTSIVNIPLISSSNKPLTELINNVPNIFSDDINLDMAKIEILTSPVYKDLVISDDAKTTAMQILIEDNKNLEIARLERDELFEKYRQDSYLQEEYFIKKRTYDDLYEKHNKQISKLIEEVRTIQMKDMKSD